MQFIVPELPMPHKRSKTGLTKAGGLFAYTPPEMLEYQNRVRNAFYAECCRLGTVIEYPWDNGPVIFSVVAFLPRTGSWFEGKDCEDPKDCDNLAKNIQDALNAVRSVKLMTPDPVTGRKSKRMRQFGAWVDDKQVKTLISTKDFAEDQPYSFITMDFWHRNEKPRKSRKKHERI